MATARGPGMPDARSSLLIAIGVSAALHLSLIYGVTVRAPAREPAPIVARLQPTPPVQGGRSAWLTRVSPPLRATRAVMSAAPAAHPEWSSPPPPAAQLAQTAALHLPPPDSALPSVEMPLLADPTWYPANQLDVYPRALEPVQSAYPAQARDDGVGGEVTLLLSVDERGTVQDASVAHASPGGYFEAAALSAFQSARFAPARKDGRSVRSRILVRVSFDPASAPRDLQGNLSISGGEREVLGQ